MLKQTYQNTPANLRRKSNDKRSMIFFAPVVLTNKWRRLVNISRLVQKVVLLCEEIKRDEE